MHLLLDRDDLLAAPGALRLRNGRLQQIEEAHIVIW